jgi:two-component system, OmpR family, phosphate regulon sensor histidine kinase PhoR
VSRLAWLPLLVGLFVGLPMATLAPAWVAVALAVLACSASAFVLFGAVLRPLRLQADALREAERRFQANVAQSQRDRAQMVAIFEHMADGLLVLNAYERVELSNPAAARLLRRTRLDGLPLAEAVRDADVVETVRAAGDAYPVTQLVELRPEPSRARSWLNIVATRVPAEQRTLVILQDVTELRRAEASRRDFVANVSHELRTPVASLKALVETLEAGAIIDPVDGPDFLRRMHVEVDGLAQLVTELLELARIEAGRLELDLQLCRADELVRDAIERIRPYASRVGLEVTASDFPREPWVRADARRIGQVLSNLLSNAVKFTPPGGTVRVSAVESGQFVEISVADSGIGIAADQLVRVFERFYKTDPARTSSGTGLGLAICKHVVLAHGGTIRAESSGAGLGATFSFALPSASILDSDDGGLQDGRVARADAVAEATTPVVAPVVERRA